MHACHCGGTCACAPSAHLADTTPLIRAPSFLGDRSRAHACRSGPHTPPADVWPLRVPLLGTLPRLPLWWLANAGGGAAASLSVTQSQLIRRWEHTTRAVVSRLRCSRLQLLAWVYTPLIARELILHMICCTGSRCVERLRRPPVEPHCPPRRTRGIAHWVVRPGVSAGGNGRRGCSSTSAFTPTGVRLAQL